MGWHIAGSPRLHRAARSHLLSCESICQWQHSITTRSFLFKGTTELPQTAKQKKKTCLIANNIKSKTYQKPQPTPPTKSKSKALDAVLNKEALP